MARPSIVLEQMPKGHEADRGRADPVNMIDSVPSARDLGNDAPRSSPAHESIRATPRAPHNHSHAAAETCESGGGLAINADGTGMRKRGLPRPDGDLCLDVLRSSSL